MPLYPAVSRLCLLSLAWSACASSQSIAEPVAAPSGEQKEARYGELDLPTEAGSLAPSLIRMRDGRVLLAWLQETADGHELRYGTVGPQGVAEAQSVGRAEDLFANWADRPGLHELTGDRLAAHWLRRLGEETYAYGVEMTLLGEGPGRSPSERFWLHDDTSPTEHGFVASLPEEAATRFFWLDGRAMAQDGPMALRSTMVNESGATPSEVLDPRVCECCPTDAAMTSRGSVVVYRDRSEGEIRDISIVRRTKQGWSEPRPVARDGWKIEGCPVNGPAVDADGERVAVAWFTGADSQPRVQLAWSTDAGASFQPPLVLDGDRPVGRVDVEIVGDSAYVSWLARRDGKGAVLLAAVPLAAGSEDGGDASEPQVVVASGLGRSAGYPRIARSGSDLLVTWVAQLPADGPSSSGKSRVRLLRLSLAGSG